MHLVGGSATWARRVEESAEEFVQAALAISAGRIHRALPEEHHALNGTGWLVLQRDEQVPPVPGSLGERLMRPPAELTLTAGPGTSRSPVSQRHAAPQAELPNELPAAIAPGDQLSCDTINWDTATLNLGSRRPSRRRNGRCL